MCYNSKHMNSKETDNKRQGELPLHKMLEAYRDGGRLPMHMPGHKRNPALLEQDPSLTSDITEIEGFDNLHSPEGAIAELTGKAAALWAADDAVLSVNGATGLILSAILAIAEKSSKVIVAANCHISVWHALELAGAVPVVVMPESCDDLPFAGRLDPGRLMEAITNTPDAAALIYTSPTYEGIISDTQTIAELAHKADIPVILDEAHGAHLGLTAGFPPDGVADIVIKSIHKTLSAPTQTAVLLSFSDRIDLRLIRHYMNVTETTSPSYILLSGISRCLSELYETSIIENFSAVLQTARSALSRLSNLSLFPSDDPSKFVICTQGLIRGEELARNIRDIHKIEPEAVFADYIIFMTGTGDTEETLRRLSNALLIEDRKLDGAERQLMPSANNAEARKELFELKMPMGEAIRAKLRRTPLDQAEGKIAGEYIFAYPPGIPVTLPGAVIGKAAVSFMRARAGGGAMPVREPFEPWDYSVLTVDM